MKNNEANKYNKTYLNRERYSSFVVDLRSNINSAEKDITYNAKIKNKDKISIVFKLKEWLNNFSFNFPVKRRRQNLSIGKNFLRPDDLFVSSKNSIKRIFPSKRDVAHSLSKTFKSRILNFKKNSFWKQVVDDKHRILNRRLKIKKNKDLEIAEIQVVWYRYLLSFVVVLLLLIVPVKMLSYLELLDLTSFENRIMSQTKAAVDQMLTGVDSATNLDFKEADNAFAEASQSFLATKDDLSLISDVLLSLASLSAEPKFKIAAESKKLLEAGALSSSLARNLILATESIFNYQAETDFLLSLKHFTQYGDLAVKDATDLKKVVDSIDPDNLPIEYRDKFNLLIAQSAKISDNLEKFVNSAKQAETLLGLSRDKRYLLVFQNNAELRASGGFLGSYALLDIRDGKIKNLEVPAGGSYDTEGGMTVRVKAPEPLWLVNPLWHFWDANWWPDWPKTANNLMWFYEKSGGPTVDGVISLTPTVVERLLEITGPIDMTKEYGLVIDSQNFWETVQKVAEDQNLAKTSPNELVDFIKSPAAIETELPLGQDLLNNSENKPKKIIGDLMVRILEILPQSLDKNNLVKIVSLFESSLAEKHILFYFTDPVLQKEVSDRNWSGEIKSSKQDYLLVVNTNIAGQKSDLKIRESINHFSRVDESGRIINTVKIKREHTGIKSEILTGARNVNWLRIYVPEGSRLIAASGLIPPDESYFEKPDDSWLDSDFLEEERLAIMDGSGFKIYRENGKTVFAGWVMIDPGQTAEIVLSYELPFNFFNVETDSSWLARLNSVLNPEVKSLIPYSLLVQKQPGAKPSNFYSHLEIPQDLVTIWKHPDNLNNDQGWIIDSQLTADKYFSILLKK